MQAFYDFLSMGGYAFYVWSAYGITAVVLIASILAPLRQRRRLLADLRRRARRDSRHDA